MPNDGEDGTRPITAASFPGCRPIPLPRDELDSYEGRYEFWDGATETAWVACDPPPHYEAGGFRLAARINVIGGVSGVQLSCCTASKLVERDHEGRTVATAQPDQMIYIRPKRAHRSIEQSIADFEKLPDVVLEVDMANNMWASTLDRYAGWEIPEVWMEARDRPLRKHPPGVRPGLTIHALDAAGGYAQSETSRAFPGWTKEEIHTVLNEAPMSADTTAVLRRVGRALGRRHRSGAWEQALLDPDGRRPEGW